ncbi:putative leucine-rich repeat domain, L domain-containing protein [Medicago truncatula]|uniref:Putative leucine-rich repeat domain, L domain-containing protein n=1 Tax=Medicago truncatula TaxID=3880 RepID=A0A396HCL4_MEDTR|nr:putative leucine-rich repeat domain, L domain-containing protein [Medicago truncatula]
MKAFSRKVTTLTSLNCSHIHSLNSSHLLLIADCFPLLKQLNLGHTFIHNHTNAFQSLLSKCRYIQHLDLCGLHFLNDQHVAGISPVFTRWKLSFEIKMERTSIGKAGVENYDLLDIDVYPQLKSLYLGHNSWLRNERIIMFASIFPNLQHLDLRWCHRINEGICQVLRRCCKLKHLNLAYCIKVKLHGMNFEVPKLKVLNLSNTSVDDETLYVILKNCCGLLQLFLYNCDNVTQKGVKLVVEKCTQLRKIYKFEHCKLFSFLRQMNFLH